MYVICIFYLYILVCFFSPK